MFDYKSLPPEVLDKTLEDVENDIWPDPGEPWNLVVKCHALRKAPLCNFAVEDLRLMIGQKISLEYLMPMALDQLEADPWVSGNFYDGDLLVFVLKLGRETWSVHPDWKVRVDAIVDKAIELYLSSDPDETSYSFDDDVVRQLDHWKTGRSLGGSSWKRG